MDALIAAMSEIDPHRHFSSVYCRSAKGSFAHLVGGGQQRLRHQGAEALAVLRLMNSSILADCWTGRSAPGAFYRSVGSLIRWNFIRVVRKIGKNLREHRITYKW